MCAGCCITRPTSRASSATGRFPTGRPSTRTAPRWLRNSPLPCRSRVLLPAPFAPSSATISPAALVRLAPRSTDRPSRSHQTPSHSTTGCSAVATGNGGASGQGPGGSSPQAATFPANTVSGAPSAASRPRCKTSIRLARSATSPSRCSATIRVMPAACRRRNRSRNCSAPAASRKANGSSSTSSCGSMASTPASATRCCSPQDRVWGERSSKWARSIHSVAARTRRAMAARSRPWQAGPKARSRATVVARHWASGRCNTNPTVRLN